MGLASRRTFAALLVAVPVAAACVTLSGTATAAPGQAADGKVSATDKFKFEPGSLTVPAGSKVTWTNTGGGYHTVTGGDGTADASSPINGQLPSTGTTYVVTFDKPGTYAYFCQPHVSLGMKGTIVVTAAGGGDGGSPSATVAPTTGGPSAPPASASASATVGAPQEGVGAPTAEPSEGEGVPGIAGNKTLEAIEKERASLHGPVSGFRTFTEVAVALLVILGAAVLFSTRPRRAGR